MAQTVKSKAEKRYAEIQSKDRSVLQDIQTASRVFSEKTQRLRQLRLAKEAQDAKEAAEKKASAPPVVKRKAAPKKTAAK